MHRHGRLDVLVVLPDGSKTLIPAAWTDLAAETNTAGPADQAVGATLGRLEDLLAASKLVAAIRVEAAAGVQAARQSSCEEDDHAACAVEFDALRRPGATESGRRPASRRRGGSGDGVAGRSGRQGGGSKNGGDR